MTIAVKAWMSGDPVSIDPGASALEVLDLLVARGIRHMPVVDGEHHVVGVITSDDLRAALPLELAPLRALSPEERELARDYSVEELMTHAPTTLTDDSSLVDAAERMAEERISCVPIVDGEGRLAGIITESDALHALVTTLRTDEIRERGTELEALVDALSRERERLLRRGDPDEGARRRLEALECALERAASGRLDRCDSCGGPIAYARLRALPGTKRCTRCGGPRDPAGA